MKKILFILLSSFFIASSYSQGYIPSNTKVIRNTSEKKAVPKLDGNNNPIIENGIAVLETKEKTEKEKWFMVNDIFLYGAGNILGLVTASENIEQTAAPTGSLGINFRTDKLNWDLFYSFNSKQVVDVNTLAQFGNTLMNPNIGGQSISLKIRAGLTTFFGFNGSLIVADNTYKVVDTEIDASPLIARIGGYIKPFDFGLSENKVNVTLDLNYTHRSILGDFRNETIMLEDQTIGSSFNGVDVSLNTFINNVKAYVQFSFNEKKDFNIPGFSGTQVLFGIDISGNLIKLK